MTLLQKLSIINDDGTFSVTTGIVYLFTIIVAFRTLFSGATLSFHDFSWKISDLDLSATLPLLFSLLNYGHKRMILSNSTKESNESQNPS
jgi:hypothetical protein